MAIFNRCKHQWRIENKDTFPSAWSQMDQAQRVQMPDIEMWLFSIIVHVTYVCNLCGEIKETKVESHRR